MSDQARGTHANIASRWLRQSAAVVAPGVLATAVVALLAWTASRVTPAPAMLLALVLGMALQPFFAGRPAFAPGLAISARVILRAGVALLGARVTLGELVGLGLPILGLAVGVVILTISGGWLLGRAVGLRSDHAVLSAGAVAICGASAALAISAVLPRHSESDRNTMQTIVGVTALSTIAMVVYPSIARALGFDELIAGVFLGGSIHDVAQVVGAGFMISEDAAETATIVKLMRVACLAPAVVVLGLVFRQPGESAAAVRGMPVPGFLLAFFALMLIGSSGLIPRAALAALAHGSQGCLLMAVAALGAKTSVRDILAPGPRPLLALCLQTVLIAVLALAGAALVSG